MYFEVSTKIWPRLARISLNEDDIPVFYFKSKQNTFVQSNKTQVYLLSLITLTCMLHVSAVHKTREYKERPLRYDCIFLYIFLCLHA